MACKQRGTYAEIRNKLHCSGSGRIAQNPLTSPLSPSDGCRQEKGVCAYLFYLPTYLPSFPLHLFFLLPARFSHIRSASSPPLTVHRRLPFAHSDITRDRSLSLTVAPRSIPSPLASISSPFSPLAPTCPFFALFIPNWAFCAAPSEILSR